MTEQNRGRDMNLKWKRLYFHGSIIKRIDDNKRRLLLHLPYSSIFIWVNMSIVKYEQDSNNGYVRYLLYKDDFMFRGYEVFRGEEIPTYIPAAFVEERMKKKSDLIVEMKKFKNKTAEMLKKKEDWQSRRY